MSDVPAAIHRIAAEAQERRLALRQRISQAMDPATRRDLDPDRHARLARAAPGHRYADTSPDLAAMHRDIRQRAPAATGLYGAHLLADLVADFDLAHSRCRLPPSVRELYPAQLRRILERVDDPADCDPDTDVFLKDVAILLHRLVPVGAEFAELGAGIPRRLLLRGGARQCLRGLWFVVARTRGLAPFFQLHAHVLALGEFHPQGWEATYHRLAELVELNPQYKGWISSSWFLDPGLSAISPRLSYLREFPTAHGAALFFVQDDPAGTSGALARSPTRQRLFEQGRYVPAIHMRIWPRRDLLAWHRSCAGHSVGLLKGNA